MKKFLSYFILFLSFYSTIGFAQVYRFENYSINDGLSHAYINSIFQDKEGFIWIGTFMGVNRYDGYNFKNYRHESNCSNCISNDNVYAINEDKYGNLWIGTENGLNKLNKKTGKWDKYIFSPSLAERISENHIRSLYIDENDTIWLGTFGGGVLYFDIKTGNYDRKRLFPGEPDELRVNAFYLDSDSNFWFGCENDGIIFWDRKTQEIKQIARYSESKNSRGEFTVNRIIEYKKDQFLIGTWSEGIYLYDKASGNFIKHYTDFNKDNEEINVIRDITTDSEGNFWLATFGAGLVIFNPELETFTNITHNPADPFSLGHNTTWCIFRDHANTIWVGTYGNGFSKLSSNNQVFQIFQSGFRGSNDIRSIFRDSDGVIWIGSFNGGLHIFDTVHKKIVPFSADGKSSFRANDICEDSEKNLWIASDGAILKLSKDRSKFEEYKHIPGKKDGITWQSIMDIDIDSEDNVWIGSWGDGLFLLKNEEIYEKDPSKAVFINYRSNDNDSTSLMSDVIWQIKEDENRTLWLGSAKGLMRYNRKDNNFIPYMHANVSNISLDPEGSAWISTYDDGIFRIQNDTLNFVAKNTADRVNSISFANDSILWYTSNQSIGNTNINTGVSQVFNYGHGISVSSFNTNAITIIPDGNILMGGTTGLLFFDPENIHGDSSNARVLFTDFLVNNKPYVYKSKKDELFKKSLETAITEYNLTYLDKVITIEFAANVYTNTNKIRFEYKLEGFDNEWATTTAENRRVTYTNLPSKKYVFKVRAANSQGIWSKNYNSLIINISPPYWKTFWFRGSLILLIVVMIVAIYLVRVRRIKLINIQLAKLVEERTKELQQNNLLLQEKQSFVEEQAEELKAANDQLSDSNATKDKFFSIIAHDLKNPLSLIMGFSDLMMINLGSLSKEKREKYVTAISEASHATYNLLENLLTWARSHTGKIKFSPSNNSLKSIAEKTLIIFQENLLSRGLEANVNISEDIIVWADANMLETILRNMLSNSIKYTPPSGKITISAIRQASGKIKVCISDTGIGMDDYIIDDIFRIDKSHSTEGLSGEKGTGLGLILCKEFVERHGGELWVDSVRGSGTSFYFTLNTANDTKSNK